MRLLKNICVVLAVFGAGIQFGRFLAFGQTYPSEAESANWSLEKLKGETIQLGPASHALLREKKFTDEFSIFYYEVRNPLLVYVPLSFIVHVAAVGILVKWQRDEGERSSQSPDTPESSN